MIIEYFVICLAAIGVSFLTLFSGFGLSTLLMPIFAIFFTLPVAVVATAVVHLINNIFKAVIVGKYADGKTVVKFGVPAALAAIMGAYLLSFFSENPPLLSYSVASYRFNINLVGMVIGCIVIISTLFEVIPKLSKLSFNKKYLIAGGLLSGFFGGLSGYQGMLRSAFLIKAGLTKEQFIGTGVICSIIVDISRLIVYGWSAYAKNFAYLSLDMLGIILAVSIATCIGTYAGIGFIDKMTFRTLQIIVAIMLNIIGFAMILGMTKPNLLDLP